MPLRRAFKSTFCALVLSLAPAARADAPREPTRPHVGPSAAILAGYGHEFVQGLQGLDLGFGASAGYTFLPTFYVGATMLAHLGASERARASSYHYENLRNEYALSLDAGYDFLVLRRWVIRPLLTQGFFVDNASTRIGAASISSHDVYGFIGLGVVSFVRFDRFSVGIDCRIPLFPSSFIGRLMILSYLRAGMDF